MPESEISEVPKKLTRRGLLKLAAGAGAGYLLWKLGVRELSSPEGKPSQRVKQFTEITNLIEETLKKGGKVALDFRM